MLSFGSGWMPCMSEEDRPLLSMLGVRKPSTVRGQGPINSKVAEQPPCTTVFPEIQELISDKTNNYFKHLVLSINMA